MPEEKEVNLLNPEIGPQEIEVNFDSQESKVEEIQELGTQQIKSSESAEAPSAAAAAAAAASVPSAVPAKDPILVDIENLLSDDLTDMYLALPDDKKLVFRQKGEETAGKIQEMIKTGKVKAKKILDLIREWLQMIPGVNKFFLEQEAKIKADKMIKYANEQTKKRT